VRVYYSDPFEFPLPEGHRFPRNRYRLLREAVVDSGLVPLEDLLLAGAASDEQILQVHDAGYLARVLEGRLTARELRRIGLPWSPELVERARRSTGGTIAACRAALAEAIAVNLAGGTHHAFASHGQGYCLFNDSIIAIRALQAEGRLERAVILDCDVHQGNGTAALAAGDPTIFTFSIHSENNFPLHKEQSDLDIGLPDGTGDEAYLAALEPGVGQALAWAQAARDRARAPLAIYLAGADPWEGDRLGKLALTKEGLARRDRLVLEMCRAAGLPVAVVLAGGYGRRVEDTVEIHLATVRVAVEVAAIPDGGIGP
jgi:acetoin utilization deacetylase AcuC-like enzyme